MASSPTQPAPHLILFPEIPLNPHHFLKQVQTYVDKFNYCTVVVSEGCRNSDHDLLAKSAQSDAFGHHRLGGVAPLIAEMISTQLNYNCHYAVCDYLQRSARHVAAQTDLEQAYALGCAAVEKALTGTQNVMLTIERKSVHPYAWAIGTVALTKVANAEKPLPRHFISHNGYSITTACRDYLLPLIQGQAYPPYQDGLPAYHRQLKLAKLKQKLSTYTR